MDKLKKLFHDYAMDDMFCDVPNERNILALVDEIKRESYNRGIDDMFDAYGHMPRNQSVEWYNEQMIRIAKELKARW